jgi:hypothetical protein
MAASLTTCPECTAPAEVTRRFVLESTDGPIEHATVMCISRHWFTLPLVALTSNLAAIPSMRPPRPTRAGDHSNSR